MLTDNKDYHSEQPICVNCQKTHMPDAAFCPHCGQKTNVPRLSLRSLSKNIWQQLVHFDAKWWRTLKAMFVPGKLTQAYWKGRHKKYWLPWRFLFLMSVVMLAVRWIKNEDRPTTGLARYAEADRDLHLHYFLAKLDSTLLGFSVGQPDSARIHDIGRQVREKWLAEHQPKNPHLQRDSIRLPGFFTTTDQFSPIAKKDIYLYSGAELQRRYDLSNWRMKSIEAALALRDRGFDVFIGEFINQHLVWFLLINAVLMGFFLKILFRNFNTAEHLIFSMHLFSFVVLVQALVLDLLVPDSLAKLEVMLSFLTIWLYSYLAMRRCYGVEPGMALFKSFVLAAVSIITLVAILLAFAVVAVWIG